jgi:ribosomal protein L2
MVKSFGTKSFLLQFTKKRTYALVILQSLKKVKVRSNTLVLLGRNDNLFNNRVRFKMFSQGHNKVTVRGVAKNPVDHPNGGRSKTKQPLKTP